MKPAETYTMKSLGPLVYWGLKVWIGFLLMYPLPSFFAQDAPSTFLQSYYHFRHIGAEEGLIAQDIRQIIQDKQGFIWLATNNGLIRYDGHSFKSYHHKFDNPHTLSHNVVSSIVEDQRGWLWVITDDEVLHCMDRRREVFYRFSYGNDAMFSLPQKEIGEVIEDKQGRIWVSGDEGLICISFWESGTDDAVGKPFPVKGRENASFRFSVQFLSSYQSIHPGKQSYGHENALTADQKGNIWTKNHRGALKFSPPDAWDKSLTHIDGIIPFAFYDYSTLTGGLNHSEESGSGLNLKFFEDKHQQLQAVSDQGIFQYFPDGDSFSFIPFTGEKLHSFISKNKGGAAEIEEPGKNTLWIADRYKGIIIYDPSKETLVSIYAGFEGKNNGVNAIFQDRSGIVWIGTFWAGIYQYDPQASRFKNYHPTLKNIPKRTGVNLRFVKEDSKGNLWIATDTLYKCDRQTGTSVPFLLPGEERGDWKFKNDLLETSKGRIWVACEYDELYEYDPQTDRFTIHPLAGISSNMIHLREDSDGNIWGAGMNGVVYTFDPKLRIGKKYTIDPDAKLFVPFSFLIDPKGKKWIGTQAGLYSFDEKTNDVRRYGREEGLSHPGITGLELSSSGDLWISTKGGGLNRMDLKTGAIKVYTKNDGLINDQVFGLAESEDKKLWISSDKGISVFDPQAETFRNYDKRDGLTANDYSGIYGGEVSKNTKGELFFSGSEGFVIFDPTFLYENPKAPAVAITDFQIKYQSVSVADEKSPLVTEISVAKEVTLPYDDNSISLTFSALHYHAPGKSQYACKLEGYDEEWLQLGTQRQAYYTGIFPGSYTFKVKAANSDGVWNEETTDLRITILPPWYLTWWAYTAYVLFVITSMAGVYLFLQRRWALQGLLRLEQEEAQRLKELDAFKSDLYANITHEFRTPLTVILGIAGQLTSQLGEKGQAGIAMVRRNAHQLLRLINQMLDLAKLESQSLGTDYLQGDIVLYLKYLIESFHSFAEAKGVKLHFNTALEEMFMDYDPDKLLKIVSNVLSNAIKFTPEGGEVHVSVASGGSEAGQPKTQNDNKDDMLKGLWELPPTEDVGTYLSLVISDTGPGIPPDQLPFIFDRFYQADSTTTRKGEGTGIGLSLSKELVKLLGGQIQVQSEVGRGTTFHVRLPIRREANFAVPHTLDSSLQEQTVGLVYPIPNPAIIDSEDEEKELVLIIEDNPDVVYYMQSCLSPWYRLATASNGQMGIHTALELIPDLIISDVMMPEKDGFAVVKTLKQDERSSHIPIILLTAKAETKDKIAGLERGADDYLAKPFDEDELLVRVKNLVDSRKLLRDRFSKSKVLKPSEVSTNSVDQTFLENILSIAEAHMGSDAFGVAQLCQEIGMSQSQLHRKLKALLNQSPSQFLRSIRLQRAVQLIEQDSGNLSEIAFQVGFSSLAYFSRMFAQEYGKSPTEYKQNLPQA